MVSGMNLQDLQENATLKLNLPPGCTLQLGDGTDIDDDLALTMISGDIIYIVPPSDIEDIDAEDAEDAPDINYLLKSVGGNTSGNSLDDSTDGQPTGIKGRKRKTSNNSFMMNKDRWPHGFLSALKQNKRPAPKDRILAQRVIIDDFIHAGHKASRAAFRAIAKSVIEMSPTAFDNDSGTGAEGFARSLETMYYNHHTVRLAMAVKKNQSSLQSSGELPKKRVKDSYGCAEWQPTSFPDGEDEDSLEQKRLWLQEEYLKKHRDETKVKAYMDLTYMTQRSLINQLPALPLTEVKKKLPFLFEPVFLLDHFQRLLGQDTKTIFSTNIMLKGKTILQFMQEHNKVNEQLSNLISRAKLQSPTPDVVSQAAAIITLPHYFTEDEEYFIKGFEETATTEDYQAMDVHTPVLVYAGNNPFLSSKFSVCVEGNALIHTTSFIKGIELWFVTFYVFNLQYPVEAAATLEFLQRLLFQIRPDRGSKREKNVQGGPNLKVVRLCSRLRDFEEKWKV